jgi:hypothetical protein
LIVIAGGGHVTPATGVTNIFGRLVTTLTTGTAGGLNGVRADVTAGAYPTGTVYVSGTVAPLPPSGPLFLSSPGAATDKNVFTPSSGDIVLVRIAPVNGTPVTVRIHTASGRLVRTLRSPDSMGAGQLVASWDGRDEKGRPVARGVYLVHILGGGLNEVVKVVVK